MAEISLMAGCGIKMFRQERDLLILTGGMRDRNGIVGGMRDEIRKSQVYGRYAKKCHYNQARSGQTV